MKALLTNRSFWMAVVALLQTVLLNYFGVPKDIWIAIDAIILVVISALTVEDAAKRISLEIREALLKLAKK